MMKLTKLFAVMMMAAATFAGCSGYDDSGIRKDVNDLKNRVTTLEDATSSLEQMLEQGALVKAITPLPDGSGYRIEFVGGASRADLEPIEILHGEDGTHGNHGVTPIIEVRPGANGTITIWYNVTEGYPAGGWVDTGVNIKGAQGDTGATGGTGAQGPKGDDGDDGVSPHIQVVDNGDGTVTIQYKTSGDWTDAGDPIPTGNAADKAAILSIVDDAVSGSIVITMNDDEDPADCTKFEFAKASTAVRFEIMTVRKTAILSGYTEQIRFVVNPSDAWIPTDVSKWELNAVDAVVTRAGYVDASKQFRITAITPAADPDRKGEYFATIENFGENADAADPDLDYHVALVMNAGTDTAPALISSSPFVVGAREPQTHTPLDWANAQSVVDDMLDGDVLDISGLTEQPDPQSNATTTITVSKDITITAQQDPILGQFGDGNQLIGYRNVHFALTGGATVTFDEVFLGVSADPKPLVGGDGNVVVKNSTLIHYAPIDVEGDVWVYSTFAELVNGLNFCTTDISAATSYDAAITPKPAIHAHNVTVEGGQITGGRMWGIQGDGSNAIEASGDVTVTGEYLRLQDPNTRYSGTTFIVGGYGEDTHGGDGGAAIHAIGKVTVTKGVYIHGGYGYGAGSIGGDGIFSTGGVEIIGQYISSDYSDEYFPTTTITGGNGENGGTAINASGGIDITGGVYITGGDGNGDSNSSTGGSGIIATDCDVTLTGERQYPDGSWWYSLIVRSGQGDYVSGVPFVFRGDTNIVRTLTANTAQISDAELKQYVSNWAMELLAYDRAILDDCRLGWYTNIPLFSGGSYQITNPFTIWGTNNNATELPGNEWDGSIWENGVKQ